MSDVIFRGYKVKELSFVNKHENNTKIQIGNKVSYNVKYGNNGKAYVCTGELNVEAFDKENPDKFNIKIVLSGFFEYNSQKEKELIHVATFKELYPLCKSIVITVTSNAGIPPVILPPFDIEGQSIYRFDKNF